MLLMEAAVQRFRNLMDEKHLNANAVAVRAGVTPSTVYSFLCVGRKSAKIKVIHAICVGLDISIAEFFDSPLFNDLELDKDPIDPKK